jgi:hypothetical protein
MLNQLQRGDEPALQPCRRSGFLRRPQLTELQEHTGAMCEAFGLDRKIERYKGTRPITLYHWDLEYLIDILNCVLNDRKQYPD